MEASGETVLLRALEALQGERYLRLAERRPANEAFLYGWLANRIGEGVNREGHKVEELEDRPDFPMKDTMTSAARRRSPRASD